MYTGAMLPRAIIRNGCLKKFNCSFIRGRRPQTSGGDSPTGTDECAGDVAADAVASVVQTDDPAGSIQEKG